MTSRPGTPDVTFVTLVHTALRVDGARLQTAVSALGPDHQAGQFRWPPSVLRELPQPTRTSTSRVPSP